MESPEELEEPGEKQKEPSPEIQEDEDEETDDDELSPWAYPKDKEEDDRIVGWRAGKSLSRSQVATILRKEGHARTEYKQLSKSITKAVAKEQVDTLSGLPATWQAFWSTVPHLNAKAAYDEHTKLEEKKAKEKRKAAAAEEVKAEWEGKPGESEAEEILRLEDQIRQIQQALADKNRVNEEWEQKLSRAKLAEEESLIHSRRVKRKLDSAQYLHGVSMGKFNSSEGYFQFLYQDTVAEGKKEVGNLSRSRALIGKQIDLLKNHVRMLLKVAAADERAESSMGDTKSAGSDSKSMRSQRTLQSMKALPPPSPSLSAPPSSPGIHL